MWFIFLLQHLWQIFGQVLCFISYTNDHRNRMLLKRFPVLFLVNARRMKTKAGKIPVQLQLHKKLQMILGQSKWIIGCENIASLQTKGIEYLPLPAYGILTIWFTTYGSGYKSPGGKITTDHGVIENPILCLLVQWEVWNHSRFNTWKRRWKHRSSLVIPIICICVPEQRCWNRQEVAPV